MPIPSFQDIMLPLLEECNDGKDHNGKELSEILAKKFNLSEEEKNLRLNNTKQTKFGNTVSWAQSHLKAATLLTRTNGKNFKITDYGQEILKRKPQRIDINYLRTLPEYLEALKGKENSVIEESKPEETSTPQEMIEKGYQQIRKNLDNEIIEQIESTSEYRVLTPLRVVACEHCARVIFDVSGTTPVHRWNRRLDRKMASFLPVGSVFAQKQRYSNRKEANYETLDVLVEPYSATSPSL